MQRPARHFYSPKNLNLMAPAEAGQISAQQQPEKSSAGPDYKHNDHIAFKARGEKLVPIVGADRSHQEAKDGKERS